MGPKQCPQNGHQQPHSELQAENLIVLMGPSNFGTSESVAKESKVRSNSISKKDDTWEVTLCGFLYFRDLTNWSGQRGSVCEHT